MKICRKCYKEKLLENYYKHSEMKDGRLNICIDCTKKRTKEYANKNTKSIRQYGSTKKRNK